MALAIIGTVTVIIGSLYVGTCLYDAHKMAQWVEYNRFELINAVTKERHGGYEHMMRRIELLEAAKHVGPVASAIAGKGKK